MESRAKKYIKILFVIGIIIVVSCCGVACKDDPSKKDEDEAFLPYKNTILMYMCGSDLETNYGSCTDNITELLSGDIADDTAIILETGGAKKWRDYDIAHNQISRYSVENDGLYLLETLPNASMGNSETLVDFLNFGIANYPAENMELIFWDHGGGGINGVCFDENFSYDGLDLLEINTALNKACTTMGHKFDLIGFDACLMADIDTVSVISNYANYMIASEELEPLGGWNYSNLSTHLGYNNGYKNVLYDYANKCQANGVKYYTLSLIDFSRFDILLDAFDVFVSNISQLELKNIARSAERSLAFGNVFYDDGDKDLIDLGNFAGNLYFDNLAGEIGRAITNVKGEYSNQATGISIYYPCSKDVAFVDDYLEMSTNEKYKKFISDNYLSIPINTIKFADKGSVVGGEFSATVTEDSLKYVKEVEYKLHELDIYMTPDSPMQDYRFYCLGYDNDIDVTHNKFSPNINGKWVQWNGEFISVSVAYKEDDHTYFDALVKKNGVNGTLRFSYTKATQSFDIVGFIPNADKSMASRLESILPTDKITILHDDRTLDARGQLYEGSTFVVGDTPNITVGRGNEAIYYVYMEITDIYGKIFRTNTAVYTMGYDDDGIWKIKILPNVDKEFSEEN